MNKTKNFFSFIVKCHKNGKYRKMFIIDEIVEPCIMFDNIVSFLPYFIF